MRLPPELPGEAARLRRLMDLMVLDTGAEAVLDALTALAASVTGAPISLISLVDGTRQWWKSAVGLPQGAHTSRDISFCAHAIAGDSLFEIEDARLDERFSDNPIVTGEPHVIHYAGMPLVMPGGEHIGTICVIDHEPGRLDQRGRDVLARLADMVVRVLLLREHDRNLAALVDAQAALRESEARLRTITDAIPQMVWACEPDGAICFYNRRWLEFTGQAADVEDVPSWLEAVHPDDLPQAQAAWRESLTQGAVYERQLRLRHEAGDHRWVLVRALPLRDADGRVLQWLGTCTDIEEQKRNEARLEEADRRKDEFLAMLAHELRNPLAPIATGAQLLLMGKAGPDRVRTTAEMIGRQVDHLTTLVNDLLDVSRVTRGMIRLHPGRVDLQATVAAAVEQNLPRIRERGQQLDVRLPDEPLHIVGDAVRITQVLGNLLNNAAKFTPAGGRIGITLEPAGPEARVTVQDTGRGIPGDLLPHVFGLFTQEHRSPERSQGGLGLGLALVRSLTELHKGRVVAHSDGLGQGSTFTVFLPLAPDVPPPPSEPAAASGAGRSLRITVVDDNADAGRVVAGWLEALGHEVVLETDPLAVLARAGADPSELYVLDIGMPGMDGYELARRLRSQAATAGATLVALTGYGQPGDVAKAGEAGFDLHLLKPMDPVRMAQLLDRVQSARTG